MSAPEYMGPVISPSYSPPVTHSDIRDVLFMRAVRAWNDRARRNYILDDIHIHFVIQQVGEFYGFCIDKIDVVDGTFKSIEIKRVK